ncbi:MAG: RES domain-containing protein [Actinomycetota bacterium]|nr:RES domain-containing protein [Actinomycetota bacterium]
MNPAGRLGTSTGLWLNGDFSSGYRVAVVDYGALNPPSRSAGSDRGQWGRFDTNGSTVYMASTPETAFQEVLSLFSQKLGARNPLDKDAASLGLTVEGFMAAVAQEWEEGTYMGRGALPAQWRNRRRLFHLQLPERESWIDIAHPETIAMIRRVLGEDLHTATGCSDVTLAEIHSPNREVTTRIAGWIRGLVLDDGSHPAGIRYTSKYGGECFAYWLRCRDDGLGADTLQVVDKTNIDLRMDAFETAADRLGIRCF